MTFDLLVDVARSCIRRISVALVISTVVLSSSIIAVAQSVPTVTVPRLIHIAGVFEPVDGQPPAAVEIVTVSIYADADGGLPVWQERQTVAIEKNTRRFTLLLGASDPAGIPAEVFASGEAQWMSLLFERAGEREQPRVRIASVPYALKASDAETLGGLPASAYIAGGMGGKRVSWQVTGIRRDAFANANRIQVEENKPGCGRGHLLAPRSIRTRGRKGSLHNRSGGFQGKR